MAKTKSPKPGLLLTVEGTRMELSARFSAEGSPTASSLARSTAGGTGFTFKNVCTVHKEPLKAPKLCEGCGTAPPGILKAFDVGGGSLAFLTEEQVEALKPKGNDTVHVAALLDRTSVGFHVDPRVANLMEGVRALVPNTTGPDAEEQRTRWALFRALLGDSRVGVASIMSRGNFRYYILAPAPGGAILAHALYLPEDVYAIPTVDYPVLAEATARAFSEKGASLAAGKEFSHADVAVDPYRDARREAVEAAVLGLVDVEVQAPAAAPKRVLDPLALL